jgi:NDP-sugar pyrophosphorylase family protein
MINYAVILCGGKGERLVNKDRGEDYSCGVSKPLIEVGGQPFVLHLIRTLVNFGVSHISLIVRKQDLQSYLRMLPQDDSLEYAMAVDSVDPVVLSLPGLPDLFLLANGDCLPILSSSDWRTLLSRRDPCVVMKTVGNRDAGLALVRKSDISEGVCCADVGAMRKVYKHFLAMGGLHIGTPQGLHRARQYMDIVVTGQ